MNASSRHPWSSAGGDILARAAAELELLHRRRERVSCERLSDPQWAILLELFVAEGSGQHRPTTALGQAAGAPKSTLLRLIDDLAARGLVERDRTGPDGRVTYIRPTEAARAIVAEVFGAAGKDAA